MLLTPLVSPGEGADEQLANALKNGSPFVVWWIARFNQDFSNGLPFESWPQFANVLLKLAEHHPLIGVPIILPFVSTTNSRIGPREELSGEINVVHEWVSQFDVESSKRLFDYKRLLRILASFEIPEHLDEQIKAKCRVAVDEARARETESSE